MTFPERLGPLVLCCILALGSAKESRAQVTFGGYGVALSESVDPDEGAQGIGLKAGLTFPLAPLAAYAAVERVFPDCSEGFDGCSIWAGEIGLELDIFPLPIVQPYATAGVVRRRFDRGLSGVVVTDEAVSAGLGVSVGVPGLRAFLEGRYEFLDDPLDQFVFRLGVMF